MPVRSEQKDSHLRFALAEKVPDFINFFVFSSLAFSAKTVQS
jgi:hypothetical protein